MSNSTLMPSMAPMTLSPTFAPTAIIEAGDPITAILNLVLLTLVVLTCVGLCCSENRGYLAAEQFVNNDLDPVALRRNMAHSKRGVVRLERGTISESSFWCCFSRDGSIVPEQDTALVLFFPTRLKYEWKPVLAILQFVLGWIATISTIVGVIFPSNQANKTLGAAALFLGEIILQVWYGYLRYPNLMSCILRGGDDDDGLFETMRHIFGQAYHNGQITKFPKWIDYLCFPLILPLHIGALFGCIASFVLFSVISADNGRRRSDDDAATNAYISALLGAVFGSVMYPLRFTYATTAVEILAASLQHHIVQEYFEAKLFNKGAKSFFMAIFCKWVSEIIGVGEGIDVEMDQTVVNNYNKQDSDNKEKSLPSDPEVDVKAEESECSATSGDKNHDGPDAPDKCSDHSNGSEDK